MMSVPSAAPPPGSLKAVILVGGPSCGTRFRPLSLLVPKPLFPFAGLQLVAHHLRALAAVPGLRDVFLIGFFEDATFAPFLDRVSSDYPALNVRYLREYQALGTAGGLFHFRDEILRGGTRLVFVINADILTGCSLKAVLEFHLARCTTSTAANTTAFVGSDAADALSRRQKYLCTLVASRVDDERMRSRLGCLVIAPDTNEVVHYVEKPDFFISNTVNAGVYLFDADIFTLLEAMRLRRLSIDPLTLEAMLSLDGVASLASGLNQPTAGAAPAHDAASAKVASAPELPSVASSVLSIAGPLNHDSTASTTTTSRAPQLMLELDVLKQLAENRQLLAYENTCFWTSIKNATDSVYANGMVLRHMKENSPAWLSAEVDNHIIGSVYIHPSSQIHPSCKIGPNVSIGRKVTIGPGVRIRESIILDGAEIKPFACIYGAVIGWNTVVGTWSRIQGNSEKSNTHDLMMNGRKTEALTVIGNDVEIADEIIVRNCIVLPNKAIKSSCHNDILM